MIDQQFDLVVIGSGPAGQKAAIQSAKLNKKVALVEQTREVGGTCVYRGTVPSKTLRENALRIKNMRMNAEIANFELSEDIELATLINRLEEVLDAHDKYLGEQLKRNDVTLIHGRARFISNTRIEVDNVQGQRSQLSTNKVIIATGSYPRTPENIPIDHENIFDSDSILSMLYLPKSLTVLGSGVIACEYASIFQALGVSVTIIDKYPGPLGFLDRDLTDTFLHAFEVMGGTWIGNTHIRNVHWNGFDAVVTELADGSEIRGSKLLCAAGRLASVKHLHIENAGLQLNDRGLISVNDQLQTQVTNIYAAGDVIGPPSLASASMEQGRRASCNAFGVEIGSIEQVLPAGIYSIPELSSIGLSEKQAREKYDTIIIGRAHFNEVTRGQISGIQDGMLKIVSDAEGNKILGVMIVGEGATELIHIGQMALISNANIDVFVENIFNYPTLAEAYRVAALDIIEQRSEHKEIY